MQVLSRLLHVTLCIIFQSQSEHLGDFYEIHGYYDFYEIHRRMTEMAELLRLFQLEWPYCDEVLSKTSH